MTDGDKLANAFERAGALGVVVAALAFVVFLVLRSAGAFRAALARWGFGH